MKAGQSLVELALTLPILLLLLVGVVDLGRVFNMSVALANGSREGARYGIINPADPAGTLARVKAEALGSGINPATWTVAAPICHQLSSGSTVACDSAAKGDELQVSVSTNFQFVTLYIFGQPSFPISMATTMAIINGQ